MLAPRRLYRSSRERVLGGVAGGLAEYFDLDPTLVRLAWVVLAFAGVGVLAYIVAWIIIPEDQSWGEPSRRLSRRGWPNDSSGRGDSVTGPEVTVESHARHEGRSGAWLFGLVLIGLGLLLLIRNLLPWLWSVPFWPLLIIVIGIVLLVSALRRDQDGGRGERKDPK